jgi:DnaJ-class molecular chaperone
MRHILLSASLCVFVLGCGGSTPDMTADEAAEQAIRGANRAATSQPRSKPPEVRASGMCQSCHGTGKADYGVSSYGKPCQSCKGSGKCYYCRGTGFAAGGYTCKSCWHR